MQQTSFARLVEIRLRAARKLGRDVPLTGWLHERREAGLSWRAIALEIAQATGETPTDVTVSSWYENPAKSDPKPEPAP